MATATKRVRRVSSSRRAPTKATRNLARKLGHELEAEEQFTAEQIRDRTFLADMLTSMEVNAKEYTLPGIKVRWAPAHEICGSANKGKRYNVCVDVPPDYAYWDVCGNSRQELALKVAAGLDDSADYLERVVAYLRWKANDYRDDAKRLAKTKKARA